MTTDKLKWWQSWIVYAITVLLMIIVPYVGSYFFLGEHAVYVPLGFTLSEDLPEYHVREFKYDVMRKAFSPLGWTEAKIRGETVELESPSGDDLYEPGW